MPASRIVEPPRSPGERVDEISRAAAVKPIPCRLGLPLDLCSDCHAHDDEVAIEGRPSSPAELDSSYFIG